MITVGLIGFGYWGPNYARVLSSTWGITLKWICDREQKLVRRAKLLFPKCQVTTDLNNLLSDSETRGVIISTPTNTHADLVEKALICGKHVLIEKPLATTVSDAQKLIRLAQHKRLILFVAHTYLHHPAIHYLVSAIKTGILGRPLFMTSERTNFGPIREDVDVLWDLGPHDVSIYLTLFDSRISQVTAIGKDYIRRERCDIVNMSLASENGTFANILLSWLSPVKVRRVTIIGSKRMAVFDDTLTHPLTLIDKTAYTYDQGTVVDYKAFQRSFLIKPRLTSPLLISREPLKAQVESFMKAVQKGTPLSNKLALEVVRTLRRATKSMQKDYTIKSAL